LSADQTLPLLKLMLPVGISFYTFQTMAYSIDVYRGTQEPIRNFVKFALFVSFFPQLVAGPIVLAKHIVPQFELRPKVTAAQVSDGIFLIMKGLVKKLAIADFLALNIIDRVYDNPGVYSSGEVLLGLFAYSMQIYCDFSGYTDMAIGSAKMFGYELPENFDRPYQAESVAKFWRRWHITLSTWVRHYIYFPLGGTHKGELRAYFNIMAALVIMGLWHGASWTFFWYGVIHGVVVGVNRYHNQKRRRLGTPYVLRGFKLIWRVALALTFVTLARILFRGEDMAQCWRVTDQLLGTNWTFHHIHWKIWLVMGLSYGIHWSPKRWVTQAGLLFRTLPGVAQGALMAVVLGWMVHLSNTQPVPFIYFQF
ncbi:MAG: alginate O-acetyltransferase complex protein AlgI, partial [Myxococcota bacterium]